MIPAEMSESSAKAVWKRSRWLLSHSGALVDDLDSVRYWIRIYIWVRGERGSWYLGNLVTYHCFDGVALGPGDGDTASAVGCVVPALEREGCAEEGAWEAVAAE